MALIHYDIILELSIFSLSVKLELSFFSFFLNNQLTDLETFDDKLLGM